MRPRQRIDPRSILVNGASSGLGAALALNYAAAGRTVVLWGRDPVRLAAIAEGCRRAGAVVRTRLLDLMDATAALAALREDDDAVPIDLAILAAGLGDMQPAGAVTERAELVLELGMVNFVSASTLATGLAERMATRKRGQIVLVGSAAAFYDLPFAAGYVGSKAGLTRFAGALRLGLGRHGVGVTLVSPGFVDTPMSRRLDCAKPFILDADAAAARIARAVARNQAHLIVPWPFAVVGVFGRVLPPPLRRLILGRLQADQRSRAAVS
ncbi:MAG: SDR family NAD(P)-dependent oxidoreductase [Janthinobacterium lividum]